MDRADTQAELSARRLFARALPAPGADAELGREAAQHARVLRLEVGDEVQLFDGRGASAPAQIVRLGKGALCCRAIGPTQNAPRRARVVLVQCLPRAGKLDEIVRMTTELGVAQIALAHSERCVGRPSAAGAGGRDEHRSERLERIAIEAARQSEQAYVPEIAAPARLAEVLARAPESAYRAVCLERSREPFPERLEADELWLVIGPEGGLSRADRGLLTAANFVPVGLGESILRTETAAVVGVALALERLGRVR